MSRKIDRKIWGYPPHTFECQPGNRMETKNYELCKLEHGWVEDFKELSQYVTTPI